jgi:hypothetical protein
MTCREFERRWNELFDAEVASVGRTAANAAQPGAAMAERERALLDHAAECAACRLVASRYQALRRALRHWEPPPAAPAGLADRILTEIESRRTSGWPVYAAVKRERLWPIFAALASTAAAAAISAFILNQVNVRMRSNGPAFGLHPTPVETRHRDSTDSETRSVDARALDSALADATSATWDLARSASEPAARLSRHVLDVATGPERDPARPAAGAEPIAIAATVSVPSLDALAADTAAAGAMLQQVGDRLATGVRPLSDSARHAFGFLLGPALAKPEVPVNPPAQKGA